MNGLSNVTEKSARQAVVEYLDAINSGECANPAASAVDLMSTIGTDLYHSTLASIMDVDDIDMRILACGFILHHSGSGQRAARALRILNDILQQENREHQAIAAYWLYFTRTASPETLPALEHALNGRISDDLGSIWLAAAILQTARPDLGEAAAFNRARLVLLSALRSDDLQFVLNASRCLATQHLHMAELRPALQRIYSLATAADRRQIVSVYETFASWTDEDVTFVASLALNEGEDKEVRLAAILAMAESPKDLSQLDQPLFRLLDDSDAHIVNLAAASTFRRRRFLPQRVVERLVEYLSHPDREFRHLSAERLADAGTTIDVAIPALVAQLGCETDDEVATRIILTLGSAGPRAFPEVQRAFLAAGLWTKPRFMGVLVGIGCSAPRQVAELLNSPDPDVRESISWVLHTLGPDAAPALDVIIPLLASDNLEVVNDALVAIGRMGCNAAPAAPSLGRLLLHDSEFIRESAANALVGIGFESIPSLKELEQHLHGDQQDRISTVLRRLEHAPMSPKAGECEGVDGITNRRELELFAAIGDILTEYGAQSFKSLEAKIADRMKSMPPDEQISGSASKIRLTIKSLEDALSTSAESRVTLVARGPKRKGGLTPQGSAFYRRVKKYLVETSGADEEKRG